MTEYDMLYGMLQRAKVTFIRTSRKFYIEVKTGWVVMLFGNNGELINTNVVEKVDINGNIHSIHESFQRPVG